METNRRQKITEPAALGSFTFVAQTNLPTNRGLAIIRAYRLSSGVEPMAIIIGDVNKLSPVPVFLHYHCFFAEIVGSKSCQCRSRLDGILNGLIRDESAGIIIYSQLDAILSKDNHECVGPYGHHSGRPSLDHHHYQHHPLSSLVVDAIMGDIGVSHFQIKEDTQSICPYALTLARPKLIGSAPESPSRTHFLSESVHSTHFGEYKVRLYWNKECGEFQAAIVYGDVSKSNDLPIRVHDRCITSEGWGSLKCDCKDQLDHSLGYIRHNGKGAVIYLFQEGRGIGLANKIAAYSLQEEGLDTVDANRNLGLPDDTREYSAVPDILNDLGVQSIRLMTNNPRKVNKLRQYGVNITGRIPVITDAGEHNAKYLATKAARMDHHLPLVS